MSGGKMPASDGRAIAAVTAHFEQLGRQRLDVPEWGAEGRPLVVTWTPLTPFQHSRLIKPGREHDIARMAVETLILKAQDGSGKALFSDDDREVLLNRADRTVVMRVASAILDVPTVEAAVKN